MEDLRQLDSVVKIGEVETVENKLLGTFEAYEGVFDENKSNQKTTNLAYRNYR